MHHYPFHPGDYMLDTAHLEPLHDLCYRRALDLYYVSETALCNDKQLLSKRLRVSEQVLAEVLTEFFTLTEKGWEQAKCEHVIAKYQATSEARKHAGSLGGSKKSKQTPSKTKQLLSISLANASNQEPVTKNHDLEGADAPRVPAELPLNGEVEHLAQDKPAPQKKKKGGAVRERNELLDALAVVGGGSVETVTRSLWGEAAKALSDIKAVCADLEPEMIRAAASAYRAEWPKAAVSPSALAKHWSKYAPGAKKEGVRVTQGVSEPTWDWRGVARELGLCAEQWAMLERVDKIKILRKQMEGVKA